MEPPQKPDETDCCNSGCHPCIFDVYDQQLKRYEDSLKNPTRPDSCLNCMDQLKYNKFSLISKTKQTSDTYIFIFEFAPLGKRKPSDANGEIIEEAEQRVDAERKILFYSPGQHFLIKAYSQRDRNYFTRAYTPIPYEKLQNQQFAVLIRLYEKGDMSNYLAKLKIGDITYWRGPYGDYEISYTSKNLLLIAQGTGLAPIYSVISELLNNEDCETVIKLFYCCRDCDDVFLRNQLYDLCKYWNFTYEVFISSGAVPEVKYNEVVHGTRLESSAIEKYLFKKEGCEVLICGSEVFGSVISDCVKKCGTEKIYIF